MRWEKFVEAVITVVVIAGIILIMTSLGGLMWHNLNRPAETPAETRTPVTVTAPPDDDPQGGAYTRRLRCVIEDREAQWIAPVDEPELPGICIMEPEEEIIEPPRLEYLGEWYLTGYDLCEYCCGKTDGVTASGAVAAVGRTVSVGHGTLEYGTVLWIPGVGERVVEDRGGLDVRCMDVLCADHAECYEITGWYPVYMVVQDESEGRHNGAGEFV